MDFALDNAWQEGKPPFHFQTLVISLPNIGNFLYLLRIIADHINVYINSSDLRIALDWHSHDGYIIEGQYISFLNFCDIISSEEKIRDTVSDDTYVYVAIFPSDLEFLLRFRIENLAIVDGEKIEAFELDFSGYGNDLQEISKKIFHLPAIQRKTVNAKEYFRETYSG